MSRPTDLYSFFDNSPPQDHNLAVELGIRSRALMRRRGHVRRKELIGWKGQDLIFDMGRWSFLMRGGQGDIRVYGNRGYQEFVYSCINEDQDDPGRIAHEGLARALLPELRAFMLLEDLADV
jgi:hypothetical protein